MFKRRTTLVVGAGCSYEYGLPIGDGLKDEIATQLGYLGRRSRSRTGDGLMVISSRGADEVLANAVTYAGRAMGNDEWQSIANGMAEGVRQASSIDRFLHLHRDDVAKVTIGKLAIARAILAAEQNSHLGPKGIDLQDISQKREGAPHWLQQLFFRLQEDVSLDRLRELFSNLTIITFNYDRVIEHYLFHAVRSLGGITDDKAADVLGGLKIIHPYGQIGRLPWQADYGDKPLPFGHWRDLDHNDVMAAGKRLRTFTETVDDDALLGDIKGAINTADQIVFLGFSFMPQNLDLMRANSPSRATVVQATCFRESASNVRTAERRIQEMLAGDGGSFSGECTLEFYDLPAGQYLREDGNELAS